MQAIISDNGELYVTKRRAYIRFLKAYINFCIQSHQYHKLWEISEKNIPTQILTDKYGFGVSFGE